MWFQTRLKSFSFFKVILNYCCMTVSNQIRVVAFNVPQLTQASFLQKNQTLQNGFLIFVMLRWHSGIENHEIWTFKVIFLCQKVRIFLKKNSLKNINLEPHFVKNTFFDNFKIERLLFLK